MKGDKEDNYILMKETEQQPQNDFNQNSESV